MNDPRNKIVIENNTETFRKCYDLITPLFIILKNSCRHFNNLMKVRSRRPEMLCKKAFLKTLPNSTRKHLRLSLFNRVEGLTLWHRCFPLNFTKFLRNLFFIEYLRWLFLGRFLVRLKKIFRDRESHSTLHASQYAVLTPLQPQYTGTIFQNLNRYFIKW